MMSDRLGVFKWFWHLLFDARSLVWRTSRAINISVDWSPHIGGNVSGFFQFSPAYTVTLDDGDEPYSQGAELRLGLTLIWLDFHLAIPNDDHPDDDVEMPTRYCPKCGLETETMFSQRCTGCRLAAAACTCVKRDCCRDAGTTDAAACCQGENRRDE